jgi:hypothetical protein
MRPADGRFALRGSREDTGSCDQWIAWSQTFYDAFRYNNLRQTLNESVKLYREKTSLLQFVNPVHVWRNALRGRRAWTKQLAVPDSEPPDSAATAALERPRE